MKNAQYFWTIIIGLVELFVTVGLFDGVYDSFEIKVISLLIIIYSSIRLIGAGIGQSIISLSFGLQNEFTLLKKHLNYDDYGLELLDDEEIETKDKLRVLEVKALINSIVVGLMYMIAVWNLFNTF